MTDDTSGDVEDLELFREYVETRSRSTRNELVQQHMGLATHIAARFARSGRRDDDLRQVAMVGLIKSVDRFDPEHGVPFSAFAGRTIEGELKRHFRDRTWSVKVPRSAKELHVLVRNATGKLEQQDGRSPSVERLAEYLEIDRDDVVRGLAATAAARVDTIDAGTDPDDGSIDRQSALASIDPSFGDTENDIVVSELMEQLPEREREIVYLRFYENLSQAEIAERVDVSQMHVSRLLRQSFEQMRTLMSERTG